MLRGVVSTIAPVRQCVIGLAKRNIGLTAVVSQQTKLDPIQELFVNKIKDYAAKSKTAGTKLVDATPEQEARFKAEADRIDKMFDATGKDMTKFPTFTFSDTELDPVGLESAELGMKEAGEFTKPLIDEQAEPEIPYGY